MLIRVLIADDHTLLRRGLVKLLELTEDIVVVGQALNGLEAINLVAKLRPDVILMDVNMPRLNGIRATRIINERYGKIPILALTIHDDEQYISEMIRAGATGYILKDSELNSVVKAIKRVAVGESVFPSHLMEKVMEKFHQLSEQQHESVVVGNYQGNHEYKLTRREVEVLQCIVDGMSNKECAQTLFISEKTVKNHITNLLRKLEVNDRTQAAVYALHNGIVEAKD